MTHNAKTVRLWQEIIPAHPLKGIVLMVIWAVWFSAPQDINLTGSFWQLLNPLGLLAGVVSLSMLLVHGSIYLQIRTEGEIAARARRVTKITGAVFVLAFIPSSVMLDAPTSITFTERRKTCGTSPG